MEQAPGLQNTSMYSALRASQRPFKFDPIEFSPLRFIQATATTEIGRHREHGDQGQLIVNSWTEAAASLNEAVSGKIHGC